MPEYVSVPVYLRQLMADGKTRLLEFRARELSRHQVFLAADDLGLLDVGEEVELLVAAPGERLTGGRARVIGSERVFGRRTELTPSGLRLTPSGYRLAWAPGARLRAVIDRCLDAGSRVGGGGLPETGLEPARSQ
ncbi:MAG: hypothetical protein OXH96_00150 [Spirochaetaceae bacterium]|nr:hypothetical protein [Spirochaetaceae bacterium]